MKKISVAFPITGLPVPAVKGGAVQTGIQQIIDENEKHQKLDITIYSIYDKEALIASQKYEHTTFEFIKVNKKKIIIKRGINKILRLIKIKKQIVVNKEFIFSLKKKIKNKHFDHVIIKNSIDLIEPIKKTISTKVSFQLHNDFFNEDTINNEKIYELCDKIIANSSYIKKRIDTISVKIKKESKKKVYINKNCTDYELFSKNISSVVKNNLREQYNIKDNEIVLIFSGRLIPEKGIKELIDALTIVKNNQNFNFKLLIVGSKWFGNTKEDSFSNMLKKLSDNLSGNIIFAGYIPYSKLPEIYSISDIAVVPSIWEEPAGRVVLEAQAAGVPVIVSDAGGISDYVNPEDSMIIKRGENFVRDLSSQIEYLASDFSFRKEIGEKSQKYASEFTSKKYYEDIISILEDKGGRE